MGHHGTESGMLDAEMDAEVDRMLEDCVRSTKHVQLGSLDSKNGHPAWVILADSTEQKTVQIVLDLEHAEMVANNILAFIQSLKKDIH